MKGTPLGHLSSVMHYVTILLGVCLLLLINGLAVQVALVAYQEYAPNELSNARAQQGLRFLVPLAMLGLEYWLWDWFVDQFTPADSSDA